MKTVLNVALLTALMGGVSSACAADASLGAQLRFAPKYDGASSYRVLPLPLLGYDNGTLFVSGLSVGARYRLGSGFSVGLIGEFDFGRDPSDSTHLTGTDDIADTLRLGTFVDWQNDRWSASIKVLQATHSGYGLDVRVDGTYTALLSARNTVRLGVGSTWGNNDYMSTYFGVTPGESARSNFALAPYSPSSGFKSADARITWIHRFTPHWSTVAIVGVSTLLHDAADSPIVEKRTALFGTAGVAYQF
ncbi:hypothetical protein WT21_12065 [Burkholderia territorii]|uniref:MipA/OmpV family protein n=1 Tax=Burkholderia territorii TaxID=1503055 RepID=UPI00075E5EBD|nr:MipA/OmpV family protein [Burkholderia territorii]KVQ50257.1 hypothetical protein WT21_12065 [Burkholderia territorii]